MFDRWLFFIHCVLEILLVSVLLPAEPLKPQPDPVSVYLLVVRCRVSPFDNVQCSRYHTRRKLYPPNASL